MICKVSRGKLRKLILERFWLWVTWCRILGNPLAQCDMSMKGEADENLPKWSWSPLSRSSSWSWSRSSVPCDVGVHQPNCRGPCRTFGSTRKKFWLNFLYEKLPFLHFRPLFVCSQFARTHMWVSQRERKELNLKRLKKKSWCDEKEGPLNVYSREDKHKIGILHFAGISQERWEGSIVETNDYKSSTRHTNLFGFFSCFQTCPNGFAISFGLSPSTSMV